MAKHHDADDGKVRTVLRPALLLLLKQRPGYGYELIERLSDIGVSDADPGGLYRVLRTMESEGLVRSEWVPSQRGPARRHYSLTGPGEEALRRSAASMVDQRRTLGDLLGHYREALDEETQSRPNRVLVVDDESDVRLALWVLLEQRGWQVAEAFDGDSALAALDGDADRCVVLDHRMPGTEGIEVARRLRAGGHRGAIVLYSAYLTPELEAEAVRLECIAVGKTDFDGLFGALERAAG